MFHDQLSGLRRRALIIQGCRRAIVTGTEKVDKPNSKPDGRNVYIITMYTEESHSLVDTTIHCTQAEIGRLADYKEVYYNERRGRIHIV